MNYKLKATVAGAILIVVVVAGYLGARLTIENRITEELAQAVKESRVIRELHYREMEFGLFRQEVVLKDVVLMTAWADVPIRVDSLGMRTDRRPGNRENGVIEATGIHIGMDERLAAAIDPMIRDMGYSQIDAILEMHYGIDRVEKTIRVQPMHISVSNAGRFSLDIGLDGLLPEDIPRVIQNPFLLLKDAQNAALQHLAFSYEDASLFLRMIDALSKVKKVSREETLRGIVIDLEDTITQAKTAESRQAWQAVLDFVKSPGKIEMQLNPSAPVLIRDIVLTGMMKGPEAVLDQLHFAAAGKPGTRTAADVGP